MEAYKLGYTGSEVAASLDALGKNGKNFIKLSEDVDNLKDNPRLTGTELAEELPQTIYYYPINKNWFTTIKINGEEVRIYDFGNVAFKTTQDSDGIEFTQLYSYTDEWGGVRYTLNENYTPHIKDGVEIHLLDEANEEDKAFLDGLKREAQFTKNPFLYKSEKASLVAGDNNVADGDHSMAIGQYNFVFGDHANVLGQENQVRGKTAIAVGYNNIVTGTHAAAFNEGNKILGYASFGSGDHNIISGDNGFASGWQNEIYGDFNTVGGAKNIIKGQHVTSFGYSNKYNGQYMIGAGILNDTTGNYNFINGYENITTGEFNNINGYKNKTNASYNIVFGSFNEIVEGVKSGNIIGGDANKILAEGSYRNIINGSNNKVLAGNGVNAEGYSFVSGINNNVYSRFGSALGQGLEVAGHYGAQLVVGKYNKLDKFANFIIGGGVDSNNRKNLFTIKKDGRAVLGADPVEDMDAATKRYVDCEKSPNLLNDFDFNFYDRSNQYDWVKVGTGAPGKGTIEILGGRAADYNTYYYTGGNYTVKDFCPDMVVGQTYVFTGTNLQGHKFGIARDEYSFITELVPFVPFQYTEAMRNGLFYIKPALELSSDGGSEVTKGGKFINIGIYPVNQVPDKFFHYGLLTKEETIDYREYKSKIQSRNLVRDAEDVISLGTFVPSDPYAFYLEPISISFKWFVSNKMEFGKTYKIEADATSSVGSLGYISISADNIKNTFIYTEELLKNGLVYIHYAHDSIDDGTGLHNEYYPTTVSNVRICEEGKPTTFIKPKLTPQEVYDLYLADK